MPFGEHAFSSAPYSAVADPALFMLGAASASIDLRFLIYVASKEFISNPSDMPAQQPYAGTLDQPVSFSRSILGGDVIGRFTSGQGELEISNTDASSDQLIQKYVIDGRNIEVRLGILGEDVQFFPIIFKGTASDWGIDGDVLRVELQDFGYKFEVPLQPNTYAGTGLIEGGDNLKGKRKPLGFGPVTNFSPALLNSVVWIFQLHDGPIEAVDVVYDRGVALPFDADYPTYAALAAATIPGGFYATCLALGLIRLESDPTGTITCSFNGDKTGGIYVNTHADIVRRIIDRATSLIDPDDIYEPSFAKLNLDQPAVIGFAANTDDSSTVAQAIAKIMGGGGGWGGFRRDGKVEVVRFEAPGEQPTAFFDPSNILQGSLKIAKLPPALSPPPWRWRVPYKRNYTVQTDLNDAVPADVRSFAEQDVRLAEASSDTILADHPFANDPPSVEAFFDLEADAQAEAQRLLDLYRGTRAIYVWKTNAVPGSGYLRNIGETVSLTYDRYDLRSGKMVRLVSINENGRDNTIEFSAYG